ncbi:MAG: transglycosylase SLT domain-containing protein [Actinobacteria bacterium]|nr:transglycosylase SLT domain-containing protein [Actinomycetota bacterium]
MPIRVRNLRSKLVILLVVLGLQAGLAAGSMRAGAQNARGGSSTPTPTALAGQVIQPAAGAAGAADDLPADEVAMPAAPPSAMAALVPADRMSLEPILLQAAHEYDLPTDLFLAQAWVESSWRVDAESRKGAVGVLQLMPDAVDFVSKNLLKLDQNLDVNDPATNARMGARLMRHLLDRTDGDVRQALMAYNQGLSGLLRHGPHPEAEQYADMIMALRPTFTGQA